MYHGYVHAAEIAIKAGPFNYITGFLISTTILHGLGITIGSLCLYRTKTYRLLPKQQLTQYVSLQEDIE